MKVVKPLALVKPLSPEEQQAFGEIALALLTGVHVQDRKGLPKRTPLASNTTPTETQGRVALCALLLSMADEYSAEDNRHAVLIQLASTFVPPGSFGRPSPFKVVLTRYNQGHSEPWRDFVIAEEVQKLRNGGLSYDEATAKVAKRFKFKDVRRVKAIYGRWRKSPPHGVRKTN